MNSELDSELIFLNKIDCNFPYNDKVECLNLINEALTISSNAVFCIVEEICRIPMSERENVKVETQLDLLVEVSNRFKHPLKEMVFIAANKIILKEIITTAEAISNAKIIKNYPGEFCALNMIYFSCIHDSEELELLDKSIRAEWKKNIA